MKKASTMPGQDNWKEEFDRKSKLTIEQGGWNIPYEGCYEPLIKTFIETLLSSQAHALKEQMKACVPEEAEDKEGISFIAMGFNDCREQTLSAIESIEI